MATILKLVRQLARNLGKVEDKVVRNLRQRLEVLIVRGNAMMITSPTFAPIEVDGDKDLLFCQTNKGTFYQITVKLDGHLMVVII